MRLMPNPKNLIVKINGRLYVGLINVPYENVPDFDGDALISNGWHQLADLGAGNSSSAVASTAMVFTTAIPLDGNKYMSPTPQVLTAATAFTVTGTPVLGGQCTVKLAADGTVVPTFVGMTQWGGSSGWSVAAGTINTIVFWFDGVTVYYSITQNASAPITLPVPTAASKTGAVAPATLDVTLSAAVNTGVVPDAAKFAVSTVNASVPQPDTVTGAALLNATTVRLTTSRAATLGDTSTVSYDPTQGSLASRMVDVAGNLLFAWSNKAASVNAFVGALDAYTAGLGDAWGLRRLLTSYTGPALRVNNGSVNYDVPFDISGNLDVSAAPAGTLNIVRVFAQSGVAANDMVVPAGASLSQLTLTGGSRANGPQLDFTNAGAALGIANASGMGAGGANIVGTAGEMMLFGAAKFTAGQVFNAAYIMDTAVANSNFVYADVRTDASPSLRFFNGAGQYGAGSNNSPFPGITSWHQHTLRKNAAKNTNVRGYTTAAGLATGADGADASAGPTPASLIRFDIFGNGGANGGGVNSARGWMLELVIYRASQADAARDAIESNQRTYWGV